MGAIVLDASKVKSYVLPSLVKSKNTVQDAYSTSVNLKNTLPSSFRYRNMVNDIANQLYNIKREINDVNTIIEKKIEKAKTIETKNDSKASKISSMVSKIGSVGGTIGGTMVGATTMGVTGAVVGGVVGSKVGKTIADTGAKVASKVVSGVKKLGTSIVDGFKWIGAKVSSGVKSATNWISDKAKKVSDWVSEKFDVVKDWTSKALKDTGAWISKAAKATWAWLKDTASTVWTHIKKIGASIANVVISFVKGLVKLVEAIGDLVILLGSGIGTIGTALYDIGKGIITGNWDWGATKGLWDGTKSVVAYDWTSKCLFDPLYRTEFGKWLDNNAYSPFKSDGMACKISEGIGYVAGVIVLTICTFGVGGVAAGSAATVSAGVSATTLAATATAAGIGKYTEEEWNKNSISINYGGTDLDIAIDYEKYSEIEKLKQGQSTTLTHQLTLSDGTIQELTFKITSKGNGKYDITDGYGNVAVLNDLNESSTAKGLLVGTVKGAWEGAQWYVGGKIGAGQFTKITGKVTSPIMKKITTSGVRVALDMGTGVVEVPFQSLVTMASEGKSWNEAWQSQGGWDAVKMQAGIAGLASLGGEALDLKSVFKNNINSDINVDSEIKGVIDQLDKKFESQKFKEIIDELVSKEKNSNGKISGQVLYKKIGYDGTPMVVSADQFSDLLSSSEYGKIFRGIQGENAAKYADQFINGEMYVGGSRGSIYGTGIYTAYGADAYSDIGIKYATNAGSSSDGVVLEMLLSKDAKVIDIDTIMTEQDKVLNSLSKQFNKYDSKITNLDSLRNNLNKITDESDLIKAKYIVNTLSDSGYYAAIRGYDAIDMVDKGYLTVLNRGKIIMNEDFLQSYNITKNLSTNAPRPSNFRTNGSTIEETLLDIIKVHDAKHGNGTALMSLTALVDPTSQYYGKYSLITSDGNARAALKYYSTDQIEHALNNLSTNSPTPSSFFTRVGNAAENTYGVDQGGIAALCEYTYNGQKYTYRQAMNMTNDAIKNGYPAPHFKKEATMEYFNLKNKLINQGFSSKDASIIMSTVDDAGACSYASTANEIFTAFKGKEDEFYEKFGYNMYKTNKYGQKVLNSNELLLDLYVYCNKAENGGGFILGNNTLNPYLLADRYDVFGRQMLDAKNQVYMSSSNSGKNQYAVQSFLNSKGVNYNSNWIVRNDSSNYINYNFLNIVDSELKAGNSVTLDIYSYGNEIHMNSTNPNIYNSLTTNSWREGGGHSVFITGMGKDCFYVSSWGQEYSIPYSDLANGGMFNIFSAKIN